MSDIDSTTKPTIGKGYRLQWEPAQNAHVLLYPEGMIRLNVSAGEILKRCDGERTLGDIVSDLERTFETSDIKDDITAFIAMAVTNKWVELRA
ncbi:MAG: pyrroloquinoline quinone biosynthesis peptide chaperone PqqD [Steroidobacteraceae bacterium]|nr:pyrroloquinoline quinone biosynthesis peptide chaperone PqqD [Steroidobacteraceae bacterium]